MDSIKALSVTVLVAALSIPTIANSSLIGRLAATEGGTDYQAYYDTEADANYAETSGYAAVNATGNEHSTLTNVQVDGRMGLEAANAWAVGPTIDDVGGCRFGTTGCETD